MVDSFMTQTLDQDETIFAIASGTGVTAVSIVRISGPAARYTLDGMASGQIKPRHAHYKQIRAGRNGQLLDSALVIWFPGPHSFTGEDMVELQVHGSRGVLKSILSYLNQLDGLRPALAGEFTKRAFLNRKLDLASVEGLADLINSDTEKQSQRALRLLGGAAGNQIALWRRTMLNNMALIEAEIDFSDEDNQINDNREKIRTDIQKLCTEIQSAIMHTENAERLRDGYTILIAGPPNAGKSTLMNAIVERDVSIVSQHAGTTRDLIEVHVDLEGWPVTFIDTAGIHDSDNPVEQIGIAKAKDRAKHADAVLWLDEAKHYTPQYEVTDIEARNNIIFVATKIDIFSPILPENVLGISASTKIGIDSLLKNIRLLTSTQLSGVESSLFTRERHKSILVKALQPLVEITQGSKILPSELIAENLRLSSVTLSEILGHINSDEILGEIFTKFCIGK